MPRTTVDNATFDAALAAVPAPYGPLTRAAGVDLDVAPFVVPNSDLVYETVSAASVPVWISYDQLLSVTVTHDILRDAHGTNTLLKDLFDLSTALALVAVSVDPLAATKEQYSDVFALFQSMPALLAMIVSTEWYELTAPSLLDSDFAMAIVSLEITFTSQGDQDVTANSLWDFGDGNTSTEWDPVHTYAAPGTYEITHIVVSTKGVKHTTTSQAVA